MGRGAGSKGTAIDNAKKSENGQEGNLEVGAEAETLPDSKPTRQQKVIQKVGMGSP